MSDPRDWQSIREDLESRDEEVRRLAVERAALLPPDEALHTLVDGLGDSSWRVRKSCVERLTALDDAERISELLVQCLADGENPGRRNSAAEALARFGSRSVPAILAATWQDDADVRKLLVDSLATIGSSAAAPRLVEMLGDPDPNVRAAAADALGATGLPEAEEALLETATRGGEEGLVRLSALRALARMQASIESARLVPVLEAPLLRPAVFALLGHASDSEGSDWLLKGLASGSRSHREAAMEALVRQLARSSSAEVGPLLDRIQGAALAFPELVSDAVLRLGRADLATRLSLIQFLGLLEGAQTVLPILEAGADEALTDVAIATLEAFGAVAEGAIDAGWDSLDTGGRTRACVLLTRITGPSGEARLLEALDGPDAELRTAAARALGARQAGAAQDLLIRRLRDAALEDAFGDEEEIDAISDALVELSNANTGGAPHAVLHLLACAEGAPDRVRLSMARTLGRIPHAVDSGAVASLMSDPSAQVRRAAVEALGEQPGGGIGDSIRLALADESPEVRLAATVALGVAETSEPSTDECWIEDLIRLAGDEDLLVRAAAVRAVGNRLGSRIEPPEEHNADAVARALDTLVGALSDAAPVSMAGVESLSLVGGAQAIAQIASVLSNSDPELVQAAIGCLARHAARDDLDQIFPLVAHPHWLVRAEAVGALSDRRVVRAMPVLLRRLETEQDDFVRDAILRALMRLED